MYRTKIKSKTKTLTGNELFDLHWACGDQRRNLTAHKWWEGITSLTRHSHFIIKTQELNNCTEKQIYMITSAILFYTKCGGKKLWCFLETQTTLNRQTLVSSLDFHKEFCFEKKKYNHVHAFSVVRHLCSNCAVLISIPQVVQPQTLMSQNHNSSTVILMRSRTSYLVRHFKYVSVCV